MTSTPANSILSIEDRRFLLNDKTMDIVNYYIIVFIKYIVKRNFFLSVVHFHPMHLNNYASHNVKQFQ